LVVRNFHNMIENNMITSAISATANTHTPTHSYHYGNQIKRYLFPPHLFSPRPFSRGIAGIVATGSLSTDAVASVTVSLSRCSSTFHLIRLKFHCFSKS
jgi:hypothetical protein